MEGFIDAFAWLFMLLDTLIFYPLVIPLAIFGAFIVTTSPFWLIELIIIFLRKLRILKKDAFEIVFELPQKYVYWYGISSAIVLLLYIGLLQSLFMDWIGYLAKHLGIE